MLRTGRAELSAKTRNPLPPAPEPPPAGRLMHHLQEVEGMSLRTCEYLVFDEADRLFEMGFADQLKQASESGCLRNLICLRFVLSETVWGWQGRHHTQLLTSSSVMHPISPSLPLPHTDHGAHGAQPPDPALLRHHAQGAGGVCAGGAAGAGAGTPGC